MTTPPKPEPMCVVEGWTIEELPDGGYGARYGDGDRCGILTKTGVPHALIGSTKGVRFAVPMSVILKLQDLEDDRGR